MVGERRSARAKAAATFCSDSACLRYVHTCGAAETDAHWHFTRQFPVAASLDSRGQPQVSTHHLLLRVLDVMFMNDAPLSFASACVQMFQRQRLVLHVPLLDDLA